MEERHRGNALALFLLQLVTSTAVPFDDVSLNATEAVTLTAAAAIAAAPARRETQKPFFM